jgi:hypothetical protein
VRGGGGSGGAPGRGLCRICVCMESLDPGPESPCVGFCLCGILLIYCLLGSYLRGLLVREQPETAHEQHSQQLHGSWCMLVYVTCM